MNTDIFIKHHQISLRVVGAWPKNPLLFVFYFGIGMTFTFLIFATWDIVEVRNDLELLMDNLVSTVGICIGLSKITIFYLKRRKLIDLVNIILNDWRTESETSEVMRENCKRSRLLANFIIILDNSMNFTYFLKALTSYIFDEVSDRKFIGRSKNPVDARLSPYYEMINIAQLFTSTLHFNANALVDGFLATLVLHACSKVDIVQREIKYYSKVCQTYHDDNKITLMALRKLYQKHLEFIEFSKSIQDVFSPVVFFHISFLTILQVMSGFMFIDALERGAKSVNLIHYAVLTISFLTTAGYYCICGEYLKYQSETIFHELSNCSWYTFSKKNRKIMNLFLAKAQKPVAVTMGKFSDLSLIFFTTFCLKLVGLWPYDFNIIGPVILASSAVTMMPFQLWNALTVTRNSVVLMDNLSDMLTQVLILIKMCFMWKNKRKINDVLRGLLEDWNVKELPDEWLVLARICRTFFTVDISMYLASVTIYYIDSALAYFGKPIETRKLLLPSYYPFAYHHSPVFEGIFMMQSMQCSMLVIADSVSQSLLVTMILHVCAQIELLNNYICAYSNNFHVVHINSVEPMYGLQQVVQQHVKILRLVAKIDAAYSSISFFQIGFSSIIICVTGYVIVTAMESANLLLLIKFVLFIFAMLLQVFTFCFIGQYLQNKGESIISTLYSCPWYEATPSEMKSVMFILSKAQTPLKLTGGSIFQLSINTFMKILKTSMSYLSVLRAVYQEN